MNKRSVILAIVAVGVLLAFVAAAVKPQAVAWRTDLIARKLRGDLHGVGWLELGVRIAPGFLNARSFIDPGPSHFVRSLAPPAELDDVWTMLSIYHRPTRCTDSFDIHLSVLAPGKIPHELHTHRAEELIIPIRGDLWVLRADDADGTAGTEEKIGPGRFVYHASRNFHTLRAPDDTPATYLVFKWDVESDDGGPSPLASSSFDYRNAAVTGGNDAGWTRKKLFDSPTILLDKLHSHMSRLEPGAGYAPHADPYDVGLVLLSGTVETVGVTAHAPSVVFYAAGKPHGIRNIGDSPAEYLVFEFHGCGAPVS